MSCHRSAHALPMDGQTTFEGLASIHRLPCGMASSTPTFLAWLRARLALFAVLSAVWAVLAFALLDTLLNKLSTFNAWQDKLPNKEQEWVTYNTLNAQALPSADYQVASSSYARDSTNRISVRWK